MKKFKKITPSEYKKRLNPRQQEIYNYQRVSAVFAEYGYQTLLLSDDWNGADFIAMKFDGTEFLKVQLKGRFTISKKYLGKDIYICFEDKKTNSWYLYPHDKVTNSKSVVKFKKSESWEGKGEYYIGVLSKELKELLNPYKL